MANSELWPGFSNTMKLNHNFVSLKVFQILMYIKVQGKSWCEMAFFDDAIIQTPTKSCKTGLGEAKIVFN